MELAPVLLFVYNRPFHTQETIEALQKNELSEESKLFIFSDGPKNEEDSSSVMEVRDLINGVTYFKEKTVINRSENWGLANNIVDGVSDIIDRYGKAIILEDDLVTSPKFLTFMNSALDYYENEPKVWHISGWNYPLDKGMEGIKEDAFLWRVMNCWGWATWKDRWKYFEKNTDKLVNEFESEDIEKFNLDGVYDFWNQVIENKKGKIETWAIYWYATIFKHNGLCLNPLQSYVKNIGQDGSGEHSQKGPKLNMDLNNTEPDSLPNKLTENYEAVNLIKGYLQNQRKSLFFRGLNKVARKVLGNDIIS